MCLLINTNIPCVAMHWSARHCAQCAVHTERSHSSFLSLARIDIDVRYILRRVFVIYYEPP